MAGNSNREMITTSYPPGWYADPLSRFELRWWDGATWTRHVHAAGKTQIDPVELAVPTRQTPPAKEVARHIAKYRGRYNDPDLALGPSIDGEGRHAALAFLRQVHQSEHFSEWLRGDTHPGSGDEEQPLVLYTPHVIGATAIRPIVFSDRAMYFSAMSGHKGFRGTHAESDPGHHRVEFEGLDFAHLDAHGSQLRLNDRWTVQLGPATGGQVIVSIIGSLRQLCLPEAARVWSPEIWLHDHLIQVPGVISSEFQLPSRCARCMAPATCSATETLRSTGWESGWAARWLQIDVPIPYCSEHSKKGGGTAKAEGSFVKSGYSRSAIVIQEDWFTGKPVLHDGKPVVTAVGLRFTNPAFASAVAALNDLPLG